MENGDQTWGVKKSYFERFFSGLPSGGLPPLSPSGVMVSVWHAALHQGRSPDM